MLSLYITDVVLFLTQFNFLISSITGNAFMFLSPTFLIVHIITSYLETTKSSKAVAQQFRSIRNKKN